MDTSNEKKTKTMKFYWLDAKNNFNIAKSPNV